MNSVQIPTRFSLSRETIKYIAMFTMLLNHISVAFLTPGKLLSEVMMDIGYFTAVSMCFFLVEGYHYTRSGRRYLARLLVFAAISEIPYCMLFSQGKEISFHGMNMMFSLALCLLLLWVRENLASPLLKAGAVFFLFSLSLFSDWSFMAPIFTLLFAWAGSSKYRQAIAFAASAALFGAVNLIGGNGRFSVMQNILYSLGAMAGIALAGICIVGFYQGKCAKKTKFSKWFFYWFYPVHLLVLGFIRTAL